MDGTERAEAQIKRLREWVETDWEREWAEEMYGLTYDHNTWQKAMYRIEEIMGWSAPPKETDFL